MSRLVAIVVVLALVVSLAPAAAAATVTVAQTVSAAAPVGAVAININTADVQELMTLSGVSRGLAEKIVKYRDANGLFKKPADLRKVEGVGGALWKKNRARIVVK
jgi:competence protein ComEA